MNGGLSGGQPPLPGPLLHKCVEEREKRASRGRKEIMFTAAEIAHELHGQVHGDASIRLTGFAPATTAKAGDLTFAENETFFEKAEESAASAILIDGPFAAASKTLI